MRIADESRDGVAVLAVAGRIDGLTAPGLETALAGAVTKGGPTLLDLDGSDYISSAGLRVLLKAARQAKAAGGVFALSGLHPQVREIFDVSGFTSLFPIHADRASALAALAGSTLSRSPLAGSAPAAAGPASTTSAHLPTLLEEIILLSVDEATGVASQAPVSVMDQLAAGAVLMELALLGRIDSDLESVAVIDSTPTGEPLLDGPLAMLASWGRGAPADWANAMAQDGAELRSCALERLVERGILRAEEGRFLWFFKERRYPSVDGTQRREVRARLRDLLLGTDIPDPRDVVLVSLVGAGGLMADVLSGPEQRAARPRIEQLRKMDLIGQEVDRAVGVIESVIVHAMGPV